MWHCDTILCKHVDIHLVWGSEEYNFFKPVLLKCDLKWVVTK